MNALKRRQLQELINWRSVVKKIVYSVLNFLTVSFLKVLQTFYEMEWREMGWAKQTRILRCICNTNHRRMTAECLSILKQSFALKKTSLPLSKIRNYTQNCRLVEVFQHTSNHFD